MASVISKILATVNAPYGASVTASQLAAKIADLNSATTYDPAAFAFLSEVSPDLQHRFIEEMGVNAHEVAEVASRFSVIAGYKLALAA